jgi:hypothetical protein
MSGKSRTFAVAAVTAGLIGIWAPAAAMADTSPSGNSAGVVNVTHDQVPVQACNDDVPVNVLGVQVPVKNVSAAGNLLSPGATTASGQDSSCHQASSQGNAGGTGTTASQAGADDQSGAADTASTSNTTSDPNSGNSAGVVNLSHDQVPLQACNDQVPVNVLGVQVPVYDVVAALGILAPVSGTFAGQDTSCHQSSAQSNG